jgi:poly(A) polymerase
LIEPFRAQYDPSFNRWPPHINLLWPFFDLTDNEDEERNILLPLRLALAQHQPFNVQIEKIDTFKENHVTFMQLNSSSKTTVHRLYERLKELFPQCCTHNRNSYNPHMTIAQANHAKKLNETQPILCKSSNIY